MNAALQRGDGGKTELAGDQAEVGQSEGQLSRSLVPLEKATGSSEACGRRSRGVTDGTLQPTHSPSWEETLAVELQDEQARGDVLVLKVADSGSRELLAYYRLPVAHLRPFQHYHLELVQAHPVVPSGVRLFVSVVLKSSILPRQPCFSFTAFEVLLEAMTDPLKHPVGPLLAVARIVADYDLYRDTILLHSPSLAGIAVTLIPFPDPPESAFSLLPLTTHGRPQVR
ncbi:hypothetical protein AALO_G00152480 [Alosa alosa]|uniref:Uncharacterized protein n=1 Tax=Alosa alosa TaxID=278164 RepID=A0AAV6GEW4_9TELE|nr:hypothetical protein AALO_G00152480 [Alosa alosa]